MYFFIGVDNNVKLSPDAGPGVWNENWHHIVGTYNKQTIKLYVDGILIGQTVENRDINYGSYPLLIGSYDGGGFLFTGTIDEVRIYNRALSPDEIKVLYEASK